MWRQRFRESWVYEGETCGIWCAQLIYYSTGTYSATLLWCKFRKFLEHLSKSPYRFQGLCLTSFQGVGCVRQCCTQFLVRVLRAHWKWHIRRVKWHDRKTGLLGDHPALPLPMTLLKSVEHNHSLLSGWERDTAALYGYLWRLYYGVAHPSKSGLEHWILIT